MKILRYSHGLVLLILASCTGDLKLIDHNKEESHSSTQGSSPESDDLSSNPSGQALEPINVAGAFLTCTQGELIQGEDGLPWECSLDGVTGIRPDSTIEARFFSENEDDEDIPMEIISFDRENLVWQLRESISSASGGIIQASINIDYAPRSGS